MPQHRCGRKRDGRIVLATDALRVEIALAPFGICYAPAGRARCSRATGRAIRYLFAERGSGFRHHVARDEGDRYYGLGDKTGPLDLHGRRLRIAMLDSLGFDPERGDPLYKHWPFLIARDGASGVSLRHVLRQRGARHVRSRLPSTTTITGSIAAYEAEDGDLDLYVFARAAPARRDAEIPRAHRPHGAAAALDAGLRADRDGDRRRARRAGADRGVHRRAAPPRTCR